MDGKTVSFYLSDEEIWKLEDLKKAYKTRSNSEMLRLLVRMEYQNLSKYHDLLNKDKVSDKQIITKYHSIRRTNNLNNERR